MKTLLIAFFALTSLSAMAKPCDLELIESIVDSQVGVKSGGSLQGRRSSDF